jgi:hypothetical protein
MNEIDIASITKERKREIAKEYVDKQFDTMRRHGSLGEVTASEYNRIVDDIANLVVHDAQPEPDVPSKDGAPKPAWDLVHGGDKAYFVPAEPAPDEDHYDGHEPIIAEFQAAHPESDPYSHAYAQWVTHRLLEARAHLQEARTKALEEAAQVADGVRDITSMQGECAIVRFKTAELIGIRIRDLAAPKESEAP